MEFKEQELEFDSVCYGKPVQLAENWGDMTRGRGSGEDLAA